MIISKISGENVNNYRPHFGAVSVSNGRRFAYEKETKALMEKLRTEMMELQIQTDTDSIRRNASLKIEELKKTCAELISKVKVSITEKGFFESKTSYDARRRAAYKKEQEEKATIQSEYDRMIRLTEYERDAQMEAVVQSNRIKAERAEKIAAEYERLSKLEDYSSDIKRLKASEAYEKNRAAYMNNKGFDKLAGYKDEKNILYKYFINEVKSERNGDNANVPGSILFFGPRGMGKSRFYKALAEEAECNTIALKVNLINNKKQKDSQILENLYKCAQKSKENFEKNGIRSIIFIDEITSLASHRSTILKELAEFINTCSEKYHCTVFAATNYPDKIALPLDETEELFPIRVLLDPPTHEDKKEIIRFYAKGRLGENTDFEKVTQFIEEKEKKDGQLYSINKIKEICQDAGRIEQKLTIEDFIAKINSTPTNITKESIKYYQENYTKLAQNIVEDL